MTRPFHTLVSIGGTTSLTLTFFHPAMWAAVGVFLGLALVFIALLVLTDRRAEPAGFYFALVWIATTALLALAYGFSEDLFNLKQIALLLSGLLFGYFISLVRAPAWAAWAPFGLFAVYFAGLALLGRDPSESFSRNSQNYVSVTLLALYASAMLLARPTTIQVRHLVAALLVLALSIWAIGRAGILSSLLLCVGLFMQMVLRGRIGVIRSIFALLMLLIAAAAVFIGAEVLQSQGYLSRLANRGLHDASRLAIIVYYFQGIELSELLFGKNFYQDSFMARWGFNLHNSYLGAWAHLGLYYLLFILAVLVTSVRRLRTHPAVTISILAFAVRALTDGQMLSGQYDYIFFATLFLLLREPASVRFSAAPAPSRS